MTLISALFLSALIAVESGGNDRAVGDNGLSHGSLQIGQAVLDDIYRLTGERFYLHDCYQRETAIYICRTYLTHYGTVRRLGRSPTSKDLAMIWNRGPDGWRKADKNVSHRQISDNAVKSRCFVRLALPAPEQKGDAEQGADQRGNVVDLRK
jgi:hypothetical protein